MSNPKLCPAGKAKACPQCSAPFTTTQPNTLYCSRKCKTGAANLEATRGKQLYRLAYGWRSGSGVKFSELSWLVDQWKREDKEAGRPPPVFDRRDHHSTATAYATAKHRRQANG